MISFIEKLEAALKKTLPGEDTQLEMLPKSRGKTENYIEIIENSAKKSAVMLLLFNEQNSWKMVLIKRPKYQGVHSGQVGLPGGKFEEKDVEFKQTAFRETEEEIGIKESCIKVIGALSSIYIPPSNFLVYPFVGVCFNKPNFIIDTKEVESLVITPVHILLKDSIVKHGRFTVSAKMNLQVDAPYYELENNKVWGATAGILSEFKEVLKNL